MFHVNHTSTALRKQTDNNVMKEIEFMMTETHFADIIILTVTGNRDDLCRGEPQTRIHGLGSRF